VTKNPHVTFSSLFPLNALKNIKARNSSKQMQEEKRAISALFAVALSLDLIEAESSRKGLKVTCRELSWPIF
jgi:hypothetical protein